MLKISYLESGLYLEQVQESVEEWIALRVILSLRMGQRLILECNSASFLLPVTLVERSALNAALRYESEIQLSQADTDYMEIRLIGTWISSSETEEGVFVTALHPALEQVLFQLWQTIQVSASSV